MKLRDGSRDCALEPAAKGDVEWRQLAMTTHQVVAAIYETCQ